MSKPIILIPSYNPDGTLPETIGLLREKGFERFVIVNDGSRAECAPIFEQVADLPGVHLLTHAVNMGKGRAMKTGFNYILWRFPGSGCIVCDADGQHPADSVADVAQAMEAYPQAMVLGVRRFRENKDMPKANLMGNQITRFVFFLLCGMRYADTQCGLRGYPASVMAKIMNSAGERFEFENTMLLDVRRLAIPVAQVGMPAVYQEEGKYTSHFNKVKDSIRIYKLLLGRALLPLFAALVAFALFLVLVTEVPGLQVGGVHLGAPVGYLAGWILLLPSLQQRGKGILAALGVTLGGGAWYALFVWLLPAHPVGAWWLAAPVVAAASYACYLRLHEGPAPANIRLDRKKA